MSYKKMLQMLENAYDQNVQSIRRKKMFGDRGEKLTVPLLSGASGIGKTACVREFCQKKGFKLVQIDCSYEPENNIIVHLNNAVINISESKINGCVLLLDNVDKANRGCLNIINQYSSNYLDTEMKYAEPQNKEKKTACISYATAEVKYEDLSEELFIVGEQRS